MFCEEEYTVNLDFLNF